MNFDEAVRHLQGLTRLGIKLGNERFEALLAGLGNPHLNLKAVHIAGTKGKGSTATFASSILRAAGYRVGTYLSPYVYDLRERVQVDGQMISRDDFARLVAKIKPVADSLAESDLGPTTEFEFKTAVGFCYFAEQNVDYAVIEVGLGGRLDATNVLPRSLVSVITNIGFDHMLLLGNTLREIAGEKAGIIKPGGICVTGTQAPEALQRIREVCADQHADLFVVQPGLDWEPQERHELSVTTTKRSLDGLILGMRGDFQQANAALAVHALDHTDIAIPDDAVRTGLQNAWIPGRLETVREANPAIVVDAAHNGMAAEALAVSLKHAFAVDKRPLILVVGMSKGHEPDEFLGPLLRDLVAQDIVLIATEPEFRPREAEDIAAAARDLGMVSVEIHKPAIEAARRAVEIGRRLEDALVVVTGSFYTLGELTPDVWREMV